uniref:Uncharacterized protein TCIL3000_7_1480 n=1 Tax=Trypanosoma congolense (strain IL3000) TaxID=1068625 RepID=G0UPN0_TRYCI|nr:unnamed protein product [Trypanosoma congolense IL3000]
MSQNSVEGKLTAVEPTVTDFVKQDLTVDANPQECVPERDDAASPEILRDSLTPITEDVGVTIPGDVADAILLPDKQAQPAGLQVVEDVLPLANEEAGAPSTGVPESASPHVVEDVITALPDAAEGDEQGTAGDRKRRRSLEGGEDAACTGHRGSDAAAQEAEDNVTDKVCSTNEESVQPSQAEEPLSCVVGVMACPTDNAL